MLCPFVLMVSPFNTIDAKNGCCDPQAWPLVQSLPELVHHAPTVVDMLLALLDDPLVVTQVRLE